MNTPTPPNDFNFVIALKAHRLSVTEPRLRVFHYLKQHGSSTHAEILQAVLPHANRASVFRTLKLLNQYNITHNIVIAGQRKVELTDRYSHHHHHMSCDVCGKVISFGSTKIEQDIQAIAARHQFKETSHQIEITGRCEQCR